MKINPKLISEKYFSKNALKEITRISIFFFILFSNLVNAQWSTSSTVNNAICTAAEDQGDVQIISDGSGGSIITWSDLRDGVNFDIYSQRINAAGIVQWTTNGVAICNATNGQNFPSIVSDGAGGAIITWLDFRSGTNNDIYAQRINASGAVQWTTNGVAICTATSSQYNATIVTDGANGAIISWFDGRTGNDNIYASRINASGTVQWTANGVAICTATGAQDSPVLESDFLGGAIITWRDRRSGTNDDIYAQRINAAGTVQWTANGVVICALTTIQLNPKIVSNASNGAIITWTDWRNGSTNKNIYSQRINSNGVVAWAANGVAICTATGDQINPQIVEDGSGGGIISWEDDRNGQYTTDVYAQRINASGVVQWSANGVVICNAAQDQTQPTIVKDGAGGVIITWRDFRSASGYDIYAQKMNASGTAQWTANGVVISSAQSQQKDLPKITGDGSGGAIITWRDPRTYSTTSFDIYAQRILFNGAFSIPSITSFSPASGVIGSTVIITGTGFSNSAAQNIVFFGATQAVVTAASSTSLTVTVPLGATYQNIAITNLAVNLTGYSAKPFIVTLDGAVAFSNKVDFATGTAPFALSMGDIDGDSKPDIVVVNEDSDSISVFRNTSTSGVTSFAVKVDFTTGSGSTPRALAIGDIDGDGKPDVAVVGASNTLSILLNTSISGILSFATKVDIGTSYSASFSVSIADIDSDGKPDIALTSNDNRVGVFRNTSTPGVVNFAAKVDFVVSIQPTSVSIGDINGDGKPDMAITNNTNNFIEVLRNTSTPGVVSFAAKVDFAISSVSNSITIGDIDGDGKPDLAVAVPYNNGNNLSVFRNTSSSGTVSFAPKVDFASGYTTFSVNIGDLDGDGKPDLALANNGSQTISVLRNTSTSGTVTFATKVDFLVGSDLRSVIIGDIDGDGKPDLSSSNYSNNTVSVLRQLDLPQGSLLSNGSLCTSGSGQLIFQATAGTGPFTVVYNDGIADRTVTGVLSGIPFNVFTNPVSSTTTYTLVSVSYPNNAIRTEGFTGASVTIIVYVDCNSIINLKLYIEGYYDSSTSTMRSVKLNQGVSASATDVETITLELHNAVSFELIETSTANLQTDGTAVVTFNNTPHGFYYIVAKGSNFIETWSALPQSIGLTPLSYDFTTTASKTYGSNMSQVEPGVWAFYSGDVNQDESVDPTDYSLWETDTNNFAFGVFATDLNGDGNVDPTDYSIWEQNSNIFVYSIHP